MVMKDREVMDQIAVPAELIVDCATQLLSDRAQT